MKSKFFILCDVVFLMRLQGKFDIDLLGSERLSKWCFSLQAGSATFLQGKARDLFKYTQLKVHPGEKQIQMLPIP